MSRFPALTWTFPLEDVGKKPERVVRRRVDVEVGDSARMLGTSRVPYAAIRSAELQIGGVWPFRSYTLALVVADEIIAMSVPGSAAVSGFPFSYSERHFSILSKLQRRCIFGLFLFWLLVVLLRALEYATEG
jgi:hypothetical protein